MKIGWWFGTFFSIQLGMSSSQLTFAYVSEGQVYHQPDIPGFFWVVSSPLGYPKSCHQTHQTMTQVYHQVENDTITIHHLYQIISTIPTNHQPIHLSTILNVIPSQWLQRRRRHQTTPGCGDELGGAAAGESPLGVAGGFFFPAR